MPQMMPLPWLLLLFLMMIFILNLMINLYYLNTVVFKFSYKMELNKLNWLW